jgi:polysaccharide deacetylase family protein (PEP-CTERM system associated)
MTPTLDRKPSRHCLSFDIEEHFQVSAFESPIRRRHWDSFESRVERNTDIILRILDGKRYKATFFMLGWVAERHPRLVRKLVAEGHEVASHGYSHELITAQTPARFREDVRRAKRIIEDAAGVAVYGYRAPSFSITTETRWALPILVEEGYAYDSSVFPIFHDRYGIPGANPVCHPIDTSSGALWELPPSTVQILGVRVPVAGGGYFRVFPYALLKVMLRMVEADGHSLVIYLHPWELDPSQPRMQGPALSRFRHYLNLRKTEARLTRLLEDFSFGPLRDFVPALREGSIATKARGLSPETIPITSCPVQKT